MTEFLALLLSAWIKVLILFYALTGLIVDHPRPLSRHSWNLVPSVHYYESAEPYSVSCLYSFLNPNRLTFRVSGHKQFKLPEMNNTPTAAS